MDTKQYEVVVERVLYVDHAQGFLARPSSQGIYPGIVMIHEWWGLNESIKDAAQELASHGYMVLAVDLYEGKVAEEPDEARKLVASVNQQNALGNMEAAVSYLRYQHNAPVIGCIGWCFGGGQATQLAMAGEGIKASVIYYGTPLVLDESKLQNITGAVLGIFGNQDQAISVAQTEEFKQKLEALGVPNEVYIYPGVGHAFANPSGTNYAPKETADAWQKTLAFLATYLKSVV